ncbi:hypothetical protein [Alkaliphilus transvaalensis]|uniref:hypothetical protein n=1 Tax=Alkaliphilus transvaalensis TaxID=114628 RepID=UPI00047C6BEE|nr:hypothetical protein [Alkaliphilus transvaalensis]
MRKTIYIIFSIILIICSNLFLVGCNREENKEMSYEIISFENAPKEVQDEISQVDEIIRESVINNSYSNNETIVSSGSIDLGKERYEFFITNNQVPIIIEVGEDKAYGRGVRIIYTTEYGENKEFPTTVTVVKFINYYGKISQTYISHP